MEQNSTKNLAGLVKTNRVSNTCFLCRNYVVLKINIKARVRNITPSLF